MQIQTYLVWYKRGGGERSRRDRQLHRHSQPAIVQDKKRRNLRKQANMGLKLGDTVPNFKADSSQGEIDLYSYIEGSWAILFSHPNDFTPVCTTELGSVGALMPEFQKRGVKVLALSCNSVESHQAWISDIEAYTPGAKVEYPILADTDRELAVQWGMLDPAEKDASGTPFSARAVFVIGPDKKLKLSILYPATTGRNFNEILRVIDSLQLTAAHSVATPVNWQQGDEVMVVPSLTDEAAALKFPLGFRKVDIPSGKGYIRLTPQPASSA